MITGCKKELEKPAIFKEPPIISSYLKQLVKLLTGVKWETLIESFSFWVLLTREPALFWRENMIAVVILRRVLARMSSGADPGAGTSYQI